MSNRYFAVPGQTALVSGFCSIHRKPIVFVCKGRWQVDKTCRWVCEEIVPESSFISQLDSQARTIHRPEHETMPAFLRSADVGCPLCGDLGFLYFRCHGCGAVNCYGSIQVQRISRWWQKKTELRVATCGNCAKSITIEGQIESVAGIRDRGPATASTALTRKER